MKKIFTLALTALFVGGAGNVFAQEEEDMTSYIVNAGFDEDLTWNADGSKKQEKATETKSLSNRSDAFIAADGSLYATVASTTDKSRADGRTFEATNGFVGQIKGWEWVYLNSNGAVPLDAAGNPDLSKENARVESKACEWVYFGTVPYDLGATAIPVADDGTTYLPGPTKPDSEFDYGTGALHLRAGWGNSFAYKQVVKLPCAKYRLEYWTINVNPNTTASGTDLTQVICRKDVFKEEADGEKAITNTAWTKHEFEFTPTSEFTLIFGFKAGDGGSGATPWVYIDGIKLYKIDEADIEELLLSDIYDEEEAIVDNYGDYYSEYGGIADQIQAAFEAAEDATGEAAMTEQLANLKALRIELAEWLLLQEEYISLIENEVATIKDTDNPYPGMDTFLEAVESIADNIAEATISDFASYVDQLEAAINAYYMSQEATPENPADYTFLIDNPTFEQTNPDDNKDLSGCEWYIGQSGGDQRYNSDLTDNEGNPAVVWNAWRNNLSSASQSVSINQDLTGLPNGFYTVTADMCTQPGCITDQHVFANGTVSSAESPVMTQAGWDPYVWETLTTDKVLVIDGKLTIGAIGHGAEDTPAEHGGSLSDFRRGWFCIDNFKLNYLGEATDEEIAAAIQAKFDAVQAQIDAMHLAADKAAAQSTLDNAKLENSLDYLASASEQATTSEEKYAAVIDGTYKTLQKKLADDIAEGETPYSADAKALAQVPVDYMTNYLASAAATYTALDDITAVLRYYNETLIPALQKAEAAKEELATDKAKEVITSTIASVKNKLASYTKDTDYLAEQVVALQTAIDVAQAAEIEVKDGADVTAYITNPNLSNGNTGWTVEKNGDGNGVKTGQQYDGDTAGGYLDTYKAADSEGVSTLRATMYQVLNVPNGTYTIKNIMRAPGTGAYLFATDQEPVKTDDVLALVPEATTALAAATLVPTNYTKYIDADAPAEEDVENFTKEGDEYFRNYADSYGELWMQAAEAYIASGYATYATSGLSVFGIVDDLTAGEGKEGLEEEWKILKAGENPGQGRGWFNNSLQFTVTNHVLVLGVSCDYQFLNKTEADAYTGSWFSADNFQLIIDQVGNNDGWDPTTGVTEIATAPVAAKAIYNLAGQRVNGSYKGIVIKNGKKVLVK